MSLIGFFVKYIFIPSILPLFIIFFFGKPVFLIKLLDKVLHFEIRKTKLIHLLLFIFSLFDIYLYYSRSLGKKAIERLIKNEIINTEEYSFRLSQIHSDERNMYIFLTCIVMLLSIEKFGLRHIRIAELEEIKKGKEKELNSHQKTPEQKKND